jgi:hypothetical protein
VPPRSFNTERGSRVCRRKRARTEQWRQLLAAKLLAPSDSLRRLARLAQLNHDGAAKRWKTFEKARAAGASETEALDAAAADHRGGSNRAFTPQQEQLLSEIVRTASPSLTHTQIQEEALRFKRDCIVTSSGSSRALRSDEPAFKASDHFVSGFKRRQRLSTHRTAVIHTSRADLQRDMELEKLAYVVEVRDAIDQFGSGRVLNMDENPVSLLDVPVTAVVATGSGSAAKVLTTANVGTKITTFPTITAAGDKLPLCAILKGKTERCLKKIKEGASGDVNKVQLYYSDKGWINEGIMLRYLADVVQPYTASQPSALILDSYRAHFSPAVLSAAAVMNLRLIQVPGGCTGELQPLDVNFNRPLLMKRKKIWAQHKLLHPFSIDSPQAAIERAQQAYQSLHKGIALQAFKQAFLVD